MLDLAGALLLVLVAACTEPNNPRGTDGGDGPAQDGRLWDLPRLLETLGPPLDAPSNDGAPPADVHDSAVPDATPPCPAGKECCDGIDNDNDKKIDEGNVCGSIGDTEPCPPGAFKPCDCFGGVYRKCAANGSWGPCLVGHTCQPAQVTSHDQCTKAAQYCDFGVCQTGYIVPNGCRHHSDCPTGKICDVGLCVVDPFDPCAS